jgi:tetratricopeptide (TPR) repeat protein
MGGRIMRRTLPVSTVSIACAVLLAASVLLPGCTSAPRAPRTVEHDAEADVAFYEKVLAENPDSEYAQARLAEARAQLAADLAWDADRALARGAATEALRMADRAASIDPRYEELRREAAQAVAHRRLAEADFALQGLAFDRARTLVEEAESLHPGYAPTAHLRDRVNAAESRYFAELAEEYLADGDTRSAAVAAERALAANPGDPGVRRMYQDVTGRSARAYLEGRADDVASLIVEGRLTEAAETIERLRDRGSTDPALDDLAARLADQRRAATEARAAGETAMNEGRFDEAIARFMLATELDRDLEADLEIPLIQARGSLARDQMVQAIEAGDQRDALLKARLVLELVDDPSTERLLPQLEEAYVRHVMREAQELIAAGQRDEARAMLDEALDTIDSEDLHTLRDSLGG